MSIVTLVTLIPLGIATALAIPNEPVIYIAEDSQIVEQEVIIETVIDWNIERIKEEINQQALNYGVNAATMHRIIECESNYHTSIQSRHIRPDGSREQSFGLVQIHLPAHPYVTYEQAIDPQFAIEFLASSLKDGKGWWWTCY